MLTTVTVLSMVICLAVLGMVIFLLVVRGHDQKRLQQLREEVETDVAFLQKRDRELQLADVDINNRLYQADVATRARMCNLNTRFKTYVKNSDDETQTQKLRLRGDSLLTREAPTKEGVLPEGSKKPPTTCVPAPPKCTREGFATTPVASTEKAWVHITDPAGQKYLKGGVAAANVWLRDGVQVSGPACVETGHGVQGKHADAGKICYGSGPAGGADSLNVVGKGDKPGKRRVRIWDTARTDAVQLGDKWRLSGVGDAHGNDNWLRLFNKDGTGYRGGLAAMDLWSGGNAHLNQAHINQVNTTNIVSNAGLRNINMNGLTVANVVSPGHWANGSQPNDSVLRTEGAGRKLHLNAGHWSGVTVAQGVGNTNHVGINNPAPTSTLDVGGSANVRGDANVEGKLFFKNKDFNTAPSGNNSSDPYYMEKVVAGNNASSLRFTINDDADESVQVWGGSCEAGNCGGPGKMKHKLEATGNAGHAGSLTVGNPTGDTNPWGFRHGVHSRNPNGTWSHLPWSDGTNYLRGNTVVDGALTTNNVNARGALKSAGGQLCLQNVCIDATQLQRLTSMVSIGELGASAILSTKHFNAITTMLPNRQFVLLWRGTRDGFGANVFHSKCDNQGATFLVFKSNTGYIATAYNSVPWTSQAGYSFASSGANWLNNLENPGGTISTSRAYNTKSPQHSTYNHIVYGPTFGGGHDLYIPNFPNSNSGYTNPWAYDGFSNTTMFGSYNTWKLVEIEVYKA